LPVRLSSGNQPRASRQSLTPCKERETFFGMHALDWRRGTSNRLHAHTCPDTGGGIEVFYGLRDSTPLSGVASWLSHSDIGNGTVRSTTVKQ
jgi:hypothetical protein